MAVGFIDGPPEYVRAMREIDRILRGKDNGFAGLIALTILVNILVNEADGDTKRADAMTDDFTSHAKEAFRTLLADKHLAMH
jgi:hypothetical protein